MIDRNLADYAFDQAHERAVTEVEDDDDKVHRVGEESRRQELSDNDEAEGKTQVGNGMTKIA